MAPKNIGREMKNLLKQLIASAPTLDNGERKAAEVLGNYFHSHQLPVQIDCWNQNRANITVRLPSSRRKPGLLLAGHLDVVPAQPSPWSTDPFCGVEQDGCITGRGAVDMLGGLAAAAAAIVQIASEGIPLQGDVILTATAGEETDSCGANRFVQTAAQTIGPLFGILVPEPTNLEIFTAHRGLLWLQITARGRSAHGSMPHLGINAIEKMTPLLNRLFAWSIPQPPHPQLGNCTMSINQIHGGTAANIVPDVCRIELDIRTLPSQSQEQVIQHIQTFLDEQKSKDPDFLAELSVLRRCPALETAAGSPFLQAVCRALGTDRTTTAPFTTDAPYFRPLCPDVLILGPGSPASCHKPDESIKISDLLTAKEMYLKIIRSILQ
jgi:succinyl-diaminopimelate desuccinylase